MVTRDDDSDTAAGVVRMGDWRRNAEERALGKGRTENARAHTALAQTRAAAIIHFRGVRTVSKPC